MFLLIPVEIDLPINKKGDKSDIVWPTSTSNIKIILILLTKMVAFHIELFVIKA